MPISTNGTVIARFAGALYNQQLSNATYEEVVTWSNTNPLSGLLNAVYQRDFSNATDAAVANIIITNLGLAAVPGLGNWLAAQLTAAGANKGAKIAELLNGFAQTPASDPVYGAAAAAWNNQVANSLILSQTEGNAGGEFSTLGTTPAGATFTLTTGQDDGADFIGGAGNDTFIANPLDNAGANAATTLNATDKIDGGAGTDTFNLTATEANNNELLGQVKNIEIINISGSDYLTGLSDAQLAAIDAYDAAEDAAYAAAYDIYEGAEDVMDALSLAGGAAAINIDTLINAAVDAVDTDYTNADSVVAQAVIDAAGAAGASVVSVYAAAVLAAEQFDQVAQNAYDAWSDTYDAAYAAWDQQTGIDAAFFQGSTSITLDGNTTDIFNVDGQTITFTGGTVDSVVDLKAGVTEADVVLVDTDGDDLEVYGDDLETLTVTGSVGAEGDLYIDTDATDTLNLNLSNAAYVVVDSEIGSDSSIISTGAGDLELDLDAWDAGSDVQHIETAGGNDVVYGLDYVTTSTKGFSISTGAGDDEISIDTTGTGTTTVDAGAGDDYVYMGRALNDNDMLDGGVGTDTLSVENTLNLLAGNYVRFNAADNFENLEFQNDVTVDASEVAGFDKLIFASDDATVTEAVEAQTLVIDSSVDDGNYYITAAEGESVTVDVQAYDWDYGTDINVEAVSASVTVNAAAAGQDVFVEMGDDANSVLESATITLASSYDEDNGYSDAYADIYANSLGEDFATLTIQGTGYADVNNSDSEGTGAASTIDAGGLDAWLDKDGKVIMSTFELSASATVQEHIIVGEGSIDTINVASTAGDSQLSLMDTIEGLTFTLNDAEDGYGDDSDVLTGLSGDYVTYTFASTPASLQAALNTVSALTDDDVVFAFGGNTYIFQEGAGIANTDFEAADAVVKLVGSYDLDVLATVLTVA